MFKSGEWAVTIGAWAELAAWGSNPAAIAFELVEVQMGFHFSFRRLLMLKPFWRRLPFVSYRVVLGLIILSGSITACNGERKVETRGGTTPPPAISAVREGVDEDTLSAMTISDVLEKHKVALMSVDGVVGVGQGRCEGSPCVKVFVAKKTAALEQEVPDTLEIYPVVVEETGTFNALPEQRKDSSQRPRSP